MITAEVVTTEYDERKNMIIWICFKHNGVEIEFLKGGKLQVKNGKNVWPLYSVYENFIGKTTQQVNNWIVANCEYQIGNIIKATNRESLNTENLVEIDKLIGQQVAQADSVEIDIKISGSITDTVILKDDGTYTIKV